MANAPETRALVNQEGLVEENVASHNMFFVSETETSQRGCQKLLLSQVVLNEQQNNQRTSVTKLEDKRLKKQSSDSKIVASEAAQLWNLKM